MVPFETVFDTRSDVVATDDPAIRRAVLKEPPASASAKVVDPDRLTFRKSLVDRASDPFGYERIVGESDLTSIAYLAKGLRAAAAVCRIRIPGSGGESFGTGFLVGPRLMLTNHHVIASADEAGQAEVEFGYEHDSDGVLLMPVAFNLKPAELFFTSVGLDFTLVAIAPHAENGAAVERYGYLPLLPLSGKTFDREWVTIIQHPGGAPKQISIRSNQIVLLSQDDVPGVDLGKFIHYRTDTEPGSSGSPVVNDQWQAIAVHHKAVPGAPDANGRPSWIANEGVRVSAIYAELEAHRFESPHATAALDLLRRGLGIMPSALPGSRDANVYEGDRAPFPVSRWTSASLGYRDDFLDVSVPLAPMFARGLADNEVAERNDGGGAILTYRHFSSVIHKTRKFALITAVNIDGAKLINPKSRSNAWRIDRRIDPEYQPAGEFYERARAQERVYFSRGHLVRRLDPCWGETLKESVEAELDTFHYTNAAPQVQKYNDTDWGNLEDYVLDRAQRSEARLSIFSGPVFRDSDPPYGATRGGGPWRIPQTFWKIAALQRADGRVSVAGFFVGQVEYLRPLYEARVFTSLTPYTLDKLAQIQTTLAEIEAVTGLDFAVLKPLDALGSLESTRQVRWISGPSDVLI